SININGTFRYYDSFFYISGTNKGSSDYKTDITSPLEPRQKFSVGFYDYDTYLNPHWDAQNMNLSFVLDDGVLNEGRAGIDAISVPLIIAAQNPIDDLIFGHKITKQNSSKKVRKNGKTIANKNNETVIWAQPIYINASNSSGDNKWDMTSLIGALGIDIKVNENIVWGFGAEYEKPDYHSDNVDVTADGGNIFVYVMPQISKHFESGLFVLGGMNQYLQKREYNKTQYSSNFDSQRISGGINLSFPFEIKIFDTKTSAQIKPFITYTKTYLTVSSHDEGKGIYALKYEYEEIVFDNLKIGAQIQKSVSRFITLDAKIFYSGIYGDKSAKADISFMNALDIKEKMTGKEIDENYFGANIGLNFYASEVFTLAPSITLTESQNQSVQQINFNFLYKF
ncbi:MAG: autotransporter outer membrane beta-barrel domain-containing protein, partial [Endomicrobium sp.]|nr:autotransporter outer membrane beta-barrel domain-containing protein [Endomicrobium sp.]